jgi:hypothetical protein
VNATDRLSPFELTCPPLSAGPQIFPQVPGPLDSRFHPFHLSQSAAMLPTAAWARISLIVESPRAHVFPLPPSSANCTDPWRLVCKMNFSASVFVAKNRRQRFPFSDNLAGIQTR